MWSSSVIALDFPSLEQSTFCSFPAGRPLSKVNYGTLLCYRTWDCFLFERLGTSVFLDQTRSIPITVKSAVKVCLIGVDMTNVHAAGGVQRWWKLRVKVLRKKQNWLLSPGLTSASEGTNRDFQISNQSSRIGHSLCQESCWSWI